MAMLVDWPRVKSLLAQVQVGVKGEELEAEWQSLKRM